jgi:hypothetical protein
MDEVRLIKIRQHLSSQWKPRYDSENGSEHQFDGTYCLGGFHIDGINVSVHVQLFIPVLAVNWSHPPANENTNPSLILQYSMMKCTSTTFTEPPL